MSEGSEQAGPMDKLVERTEVRAKGTRQEMRTWGTVFS